MRWRGLFLLVVLLLLSGELFHWHLRDPTLPSEMIRVPAGVFSMGVLEAHGSRKPPRPVYLDSFEMDLTEVTLAQYRRFVEETGYKPPYVAEEWAAPFNWANGQPPAGYEQHPITLVSWYDAKAYCTWAGKRLPTEAEWEKAARGLDGRRYPWGDTWKVGAANHGNAKGYDDSDGYLTTSPVGAFPTGRSPYGILDLFGNAWEWTDDWYSDDWSEVRAGRFKGVLVNPRGPESGYYRAARGGSYFFDLEHDWQAERAFMFPESRRKTSGFRCARDVPGEARKGDRLPLRSAVP